MDPETLLALITQLRQELDDLNFKLTRKTGLGSADIKGRITGTAATDSVATASIQSAAVTKSKLSYEVVTLAFGAADTSKSTTITSGSIILGVYSSTVTSTPAYGELKLEISGVTLTGTRSAAPGGASAITYTITLLKAT
jgi:hypothetical protein